MNIQWKKLFTLKFNLVLMFISVDFGKKNSVFWCKQACFCLHHLWILSIPKRKLEIDEQSNFCSLLNHKWNEMAWMKSVVFCTLWMVCLIHSVPARRPAGASGEFPKMFLRELVTVLKGGPVYSLESCSVEQKQKKVWFPSENNSSAFVWWCT